MQTSALQRACTAIGWPLKLLPGACCRYDGVQGVYPNVSGGSTPIDFSLEYHIFAVEWSDAELHWYVDGKLVFSRFRGEPSSLFLPPVRVMMMLMMMLMLMKKMMVMMMVMLMMMLMMMC